MSNLIFIDSFDHYSTAQILRKWTSTSGAPSIVTSPVRTGPQAIQGGAGNFAFKTFNASYAQLTAGAAYQTQGFANAILTFQNASPAVTFLLQHVGDGRLNMFFQYGGQSATSPASTWVMNTNQWYYIETQATITGGPPASVNATAQVNGVTILTWTGTLSSAGLAGLMFNAVALGGPGAGLNATVDDFYCTDTEFLGDIRIGVLYPNAAGDSAGWTASSTGLANYTMVLEHIADDDATYNKAPTTGLKDLYNLDDISPAFTGPIKGVQANWCVKKSDGGVGSVKGAWKSGSTEIDQSQGDNFIPPNGFNPSYTSYLYSREAERNSLFTSSPWTIAEVNGLQLGIIRTA